MFANFSCKFPLTTIPFNILPLDHSTGMNVSVFLDLVFHRKLIFANIRTINRFVYSAQKTIYLSGITKSYITRMA